MNPNSATLDGAGETQEASKVLPTTSGDFDGADWISFGVTATLALSLYLASLAPSVTLGFSGIFATAAWHGGVSHPPGYPLWTMYAGIVSHLLPVSNIAWRAAFASALAGALACGVIALMVSRNAGAWTERPCGVPRFTPRQARGLRIVCGYVAGLVFAANGTLWQRAVIADVWTLSLLLLCIVLCLTFRWARTPGRTRYLYAACFVYGLTLTDSQIMLSAAPALPFLVAAGNRRIARDFFLAGGIVFITGFVLARHDSLPLLGRDGVASSLFPLFVVIGTGWLAAGVILAILTRGAFTEWKRVLGCAGMFLLGLLFYFYVPIASMSNPPMNWGYPRTVQGFFHVLTRGQYERIRPTSTAAAFWEQLRHYGGMTAREFGGVFLLLAFAPLVCLRRMPSPERAWLLGSLAVFASLAALTLILLNPSASSNWEVARLFFSSSYIVLAIWLGNGLALAVSFLARPMSPPPVPVLP